MENEQDRLPESKQKTKQDVATSTQSHIACLDT